METTLTISGKAISEGDLETQTTSTNLPGGRKRVWVCQNPILTQHNIPQTSNTRGPNKEACHNAQETATAVSIPTTRFTVGFCHVYFKAGRWSTDEILTIDMNGKLKFSPKLSTFKNYFFNLRL